MKTSYPHAHDSWRALIDVYRQKSNPVLDNDYCPEPYEPDDTPVKSDAQRIFHRGKYPIRLRVTTIAE